MLLLFFIWTYRTDGTKMFTLTYFVQTYFTHLDKSYLYLLIFAPIKDFLDVYNVELPGLTYNTLKRPKYRNLPLILTSAVLFQFLEI